MSSELQHFLAANEQLALIVDLRHHDSVSWITIAHAVVLPCIPACAGQIADAIAHRSGRQWGAILLSGLLRVFLAGVMQIRNGPSLVRPVLLREFPGDIHGRFQMRHALFDIDLNGILYRILVTFDFGCDAVEACGLGAIEGIGLGLNPSFRKQFCSPDPLTFNEAVELKDETTSCLVLAYRHACRYS